MKGQESAPCTLCNSSACLYCTLTIIAARMQRRLCFLLVRVFLVSESEPPQQQLRLDVQLATKVHSNSLRKFTAHSLLPL